MCAYDQFQSQPRAQSHAMNQRVFRIGMCIVGAWVCAPKLAYAYIGVTLSTGALMIIGLLIFSILIALYVLVWFPIRRRLKRSRSLELTSSDADAHESE